MVLFQVRGRKFERMQDFECQLKLLSVSEPQVRSWLEVATRFPEVDQLPSIAVHGSPVHINGLGDTDITPALTCNHHSSVVRVLRAFSIWFTLTYGSGVPLASSFDWLMTFWD